MLDSIFHQAQQSWQLYLQSYHGDVVRFFLCFIAILVALLIVKKVILTNLQKQAKKVSIDLNDLIYGILKTWNLTAIILFAFLLSVNSIAISANFERYNQIALNAVVGWYGVQTLLVFVKFGFNRYVSRRQRSETDFDPTVILFFKQIATVLIWILAGLIIAQNLGYQLSVVLGGLGLGGLAVAFAVQNVLADVFSSVSIYFDRPFKIGDYIVVGQDGGVVKKIGIKSTRLQTLQGEELVISNKELTESRVSNYKKMMTRRVVIHTGFEYSTPTKILKKIPKIFEDIISKQKHATFGRSHLKTLGEYSLEFETVYTVNTSEYSIYMDTQHTINLTLLDEFKKQKIEVAFPTQKMLNVSL
jgi:small-conductance mechanosensitive channel